MKAKIRKISCELPKKIVSNADLQTENPDWDMEKAFQRTGVESRHIAEIGETALDLAQRACLSLFAQNPALKEKIDALIFCTQSSDFVLPGNSSLLHERLGLPDEVFAYDYNLACSGFIYGLAMITGLLSANIVKNALLVTADTYSKYIHPRDRSTRTVFGDGAAATWISAVEEDEVGLIDIACATWGKGYENFIIPAGGCRLPSSDATRQLKRDVVGNLRSAENIHMNGSGVLRFVKEKVPAQIHHLLKKNQLQLSDVDLIVAHQASRLALETLGELLDVEPEKMYSHLLTVGNTVSASIPIALQSAISSGRAQKGDLVLLVGFGVGLSYGCCLVEI